MSLRRLDSFDRSLNKNTSWIGEKGFWLYYALLLIIGRICSGVVLYTTGIMKADYAWTVVNVLHAMITFYIMHWAKGTPFMAPEDQGRYDHDTFWEQIDAGRQYTTNRKIFALVPVIIFCFAAYAADWITSAVYINLIALLLSLIPKLGALHHVRIAGINKD